jgi:cbb3-type cytochrome oxidase subunit 3
MEAYDEEADYSKSKQSEKNIKYTSPATKETPQAEPKAEPEQGYTASAAARAEKMGNKRFVRAANFEFKVKDVVKSTYQLENITVESDGYVEKSEIRSDNLREYTYAVSPDSVQNITVYKLSASLRLRVPANKLDSALKMIAPLVDKMNYRIVKADDVSIAELEKKLDRARAQQSDSRISQAMQERRGNINDAVEAERARADAKERADRAYLDNLKLNDRIAYSLIEVNIYQDEISKTDTRASEKIIEEFKPGFGSELVDALANGWEIMKAIILFFVNIWFLLVIIVAIYFVYRYFKRRRNRTRE